MFRYFTVKQIWWPSSYSYIIGRKGSFSLKYSPNEYLCLLCPQHTDCRWSSCPISYMYIIFGFLTYIHVFRHVNTNGKGIYISRSFKYLFSIYLKKPTATADCCGFYYFIFLETGFHSIAYLRYILTAKLKLLFSIQDYAGLLVYITHTFLSSDNSRWY